MLIGSTRSLTIFHSTSENSFKIFGRLINTSLADEVANFTNNYLHSNLLQIKNGTLEIDGLILKYYIKEAFISLSKHLVPKVFEKNTVISESVQAVVDGTVTQVLKITKQFFRNYKIPINLTGNFLNISEQEQALNSQNIITEHITGIFEGYIKNNLITTIFNVLNVTEGALSNVQVPYTSNYLKNIIYVIFNSAVKIALTTVEDIQTNFNKGVQYVLSTGK